MVRMHVHREDAIDAERRLIDAHHHLWNPPVDEKGWPVPRWMIKTLYPLTLARPRTHTRVCSRTRARDAQASAHVHTHDYMYTYMQTRIHARMYACMPAHMCRYWLKPPITHTILSGETKKTPTIPWTFSDWGPMPVPYMESQLLRDIHSLPQGDGLPAKFARLGHNVCATVYIESGWHDGKAVNPAAIALPEADMAQGVASRSPRLCTGIVAHVPLSQGADAVRAALQAVSGSCENLRGIRDSIMWTDRGSQFVPPGNTKDKPYDANFRSGFSVLSEFGLTYDSWLCHEQLPALRDLAIAFPRFPWTHSQRAEKF